MQIINRYADDDEFVKVVKEQINKLPEFWLDNVSRITTTNETHYEFKITSGYAWVDHSHCQLTVTFINGWFSCHVIDYDQVHIKSKTLIGCLYGILKYHQKFLINELQDYTKKMNKGMGEYTYFPYIEESYDII